MKNTCRATAFEAGFCLRTKECRTRMDCDRQPACAFSPCLQQNYARKSIWQYRTKSVWRLCTPSACKFPVIFHKNAREYIKYSLRFLFHLTKNLTTHLSHNLCAVLPITPLSANADISAQGTSSGRPKGEPFVFASPS